MDEDTLSILTTDNDKLAVSDETRKYHRAIKKRVKEIYEIAENAKLKGFDPKKYVEIYLAQSAASRTEGLVGPPGVANRLREMEEDDSLSKDKIVIAIAKEIAAGKLMEGSVEELADQALRTALSYQTESITAAPIEGIGKVLLKSNPDGSQYLAVYYSGPIRSAGGTAQGVSIYIADEIRKELGLAKYKATEPEVERMLEEVRLYNKIMHLQLPTSDDEIRHAWRNIPIMVTGDATESEEVSGYRNIASMDSNRVRGGACLVLNDGLVGRAKKITKRTKKLKLEGWEWLEEIASGKYTDKRATEGSGDEKPTKVMPDYSFASDALMGRPTFADATAEGGFRLRYGHSRHTGIAGIGIHPGTMAAVDDFLAPGTHVRTERPGKGSIVVAIDTIKAPIVKLKNGDVVELQTFEEGKKVQKQISEVLFMGDMLVGVGEFTQNNYRLSPPGYNPEWWALELMDAGWEGNKDNVHEIKFFNNLYRTKFDWKEVEGLSREYKIAIHPDYTPAWIYLNTDEVIELQKEIWSSENNLLSMEIKTVLEKALILHKVIDDKLDIGKLMDALKVQLPLDAKITDGFEDGLQAVQSISELPVKDLIGTTIGARMGRPEKAKPRLMKPKLHGLFPVGEEKRIHKELQKALEQNIINVRLANRKCTDCRIEQFQLYCTKCGEETKLIGKCMNRNCKRANDEGPCDFCGGRVGFTKYYSINLTDHLQNTRKRIGSFPKLVKLKDQLTNPSGMPELIDKGILRAEYDLNVFRDGTIRYDATDAPLTHFYPREIMTNIDKLIELGYTHDIYGEPLVSKDQLLELKVQDIIIHESTIDHLVNVSKFVDNELEKIYKMDRFYNIDRVEQLLGLLVIGLAPHTSAGVIGRIIGFTKSSVCWAHPFWHASKRRNCDGDEDGIILLMDGLLNFSKEYLPTTTGSKMDVPLVIVVTLNPNEVDDEAFNLDCMSNYGLDFYKAAVTMEMPSSISNILQRAEQRLGTTGQYEGFLFSHDTHDISEGPSVTRYKDSSLNIRDKLNEQLNLARKIRAVDEQMTAQRILEKHALPDLQGNLRAFASQKVRCVSCNTKYRRVPLNGKCKNPKCESSNVILTVPPRGVSKYFDICKRLVEEFNLGTYHENRIERIKMALDSLFPEETEDLMDLNDWF